jgi:tRNA(adenine34) deaminase
MSPDAASDDFFMAAALEEARRAAEKGEVPVGAILVQNNRILARGHNQVIRRKDPTAHAEILVVRRAGRVLGNYRLLETTLYVTLEPCPMCVGALIHARIARLVFGALDSKTGAVCSVLSLLMSPFHNHTPRVTANVLADPCASLLRAFFQARRLKNCASGTFGST